MYLERIEIQNIRSIQNAVWDDGFNPAAGAGWHVILGDNGSGKSSFVRAVALALVGPSEAKALRQDWNEWLRRGEQRGSVRLTVSRDRKYDPYPVPGAPPDDLREGRTKKRLSDRWHDCPLCTASLDRDTNAAINLLTLSVEKSHDGIT